MLPRALLLSLAVVCATVSLCAGSHTPEVTLRWNGLPFEWPCLSTKNIFISSGKYIPKNVLPTRGVILGTDLVAASPRLRSGTPVTVAVAALKTNKCSLLFKPFPCWTLQEEGNCQALQSVVDIVPGPHNTVWVLDTGITETLESPKKRCPPKIIGLDAKTGKAVKVISLANLVTPTSRLQYLLVDVASDGRLYVYISDAASRAIIIYCVSGNRGWRVVLPPAVTSGCKRNDVLYIALMVKKCGAKVLYFTYLSGTNVFSINAEYLRRGSSVGRVVDVGSKTAKIVVLGTDGGCNILFRYKGKNDIYRWDVNTPFTPAYFVLVSRGCDCRLATQVIADYRRNKLFVLESNIQDYIAGTVSCLGVHVALRPLVGNCDC